MIYLPDIYDGDQLKFQRLSDGMIHIDMFNDDDSQSSKIQLSELKRVVELLEQDAKDN